MTKPLLAVIFSGLSFLILINAIWWLGLAFAIAGVILSSSIIRKGADDIKKWGLAGVILCMAAAVIFLFTNR